MIAVQKSAPHPSFLRPRSALMFASKLARILGTAVAVVAVLAPLGSQTPAMAEYMGELGSEGQAERLLAVQLVLPEFTGSSRFDLETVGLVTALLETALADLPGVVPRVGETPVAFGLRRAPSGLIAEGGWTLDLRLGFEGEMFVVDTELCDPEGACRIYVQRGDIDRPEPAVATVVAAMGEQLKRDTLPLEARWRREQSADPYALLMAGRAAAVWYGLRADVSESSVGNPRRDPVARAVFLDPTMPIAQWVRSQVARTPADRLEGAREAWEVRPDSSALAAAYASALEATDPGEAWRVWQHVDAMSPADPRYTVARARAALRAGDSDEAERILENLDSRLLPARALAELEVSLADTRGVPAPDADLARWQASDRDALEPVRRRVALRVAEGRHIDAMPLTIALATRGAPEESDRLALALSSELGRWELAAEAALRLGDYPMANRLQARAAADQPARAAELLAGADTPQALLARAMALREVGALGPAMVAVKAAKALAPWSPDVLAVEYGVLRALGDSEGAAAVRMELRRADPARAVDDE